MIPTGPVLAPPAGFACQTAAFRLSARQEAREQTNIRRFSKADSILPRSSIAALRAQLVAEANMARGRPQPQRSAYTVERLNGGCSLIRLVSRQSRQPAE
jgi:hypothetical protein